MRHRDRKDARIYDDGTIRPAPPGRRVDPATRDALEATHEPRTVGGREVFIPKDVDDRNDD